MLRRWIKNPITWSHTRNRMQTLKIKFTLITGYFTTLYQLHKFWTRTEKLDHKYRKSSPKLDLTYPSKGFNKKFYTTGYFQPAFKLLKQTTVRNIILTWCRDCVRGEATWEYYVQRNWMIHILLLLEVASRWDAYAARRDERRSTVGTSLAWERRKCKVWELC
jgi:hypothetical protein